VSVEEITVEEWIDWFHHPQTKQYMVLLDKLRLDMLQSTMGMEPGAKRDAHIDRCHGIQRAIDFISELKEGGKDE
jgi:hypothetical protein